MGTKRLPRKDSIAFLALEALLDHGGIAGPGAWHQLVAKEMTYSNFNERAINPLVARGLVSPGVAYEITPYGKGLLSKGAQEDEEVSPPVVGISRQPVPWRDLNRSRSAQVFRPGAFDYREYPSVMGGVPVPYRKGTATDDV